MSVIRQQQISSTEIVSVMKPQKRVVKNSTKQTHNDADDLKNSCEHMKKCVASIETLLFSVSSLCNNLSIKHACVLTEDIFSIVRFLSSTGTCADR